MHLRQDLELSAFCGIHGIYIPAFSASGMPVMGKAVILNETCRYLWENLYPLTTFTLTDAANLLVGEYEIELEVATEDCKTILTEWIKMGMVLRDE